MVRKSPVSSTKSGAFSTARWQMPASRSTDMNGPRCGSVICTSRSGRCDTRLAAGVPRQRRHHLTIGDDDVACFFAGPQRLEHADPRREVGHQHAGQVEADGTQQHPRQRQQRARREERTGHADERAVRQRAHARPNQPDGLHEHRRVQVTEEPGTTRRL